MSRPELKCFSWPVVGGWDSPGTRWGWSFRPISALRALKQNHPEKCYMVSLGRRAVLGTSMQKVEGEERLQSMSHTRIVNFSSPHLKKT